MGPVCSVRGVLAHIEGSVLVVLEWSRMERCNVRNADGCGAECVRRELLTLESANGKMREGYENRTSLTLTSKRS